MAKLFVLLLLLLATSLSLSQSVSQSVSQSRGSGRGEPYTTYHAALVCSAAETAAIVVATQCLLVRTLHAASRGGGGCHH
jgi:hypothetical protein